MAVKTSRIQGFGWEGPKGLGGCDWWGRTRGRQGRMVSVRYRGAFCGLRSRFLYSGVLRWRVCGGVCFAPYARVSFVSRHKRNQKILPLPWPCAALQVPSLRRCSGGRRAGPSMAPRLSRLLPLNPLRNDSTRPALMGRVGQKRWIKSGGSKAVDQKPEIKSRRSKAGDQRPLCPWAMAEDSGCQRGKTTFKQALPEPPAPDSSRPAWPRTAPDLRHSIASAHPILAPASYTPRPHSR